MADFARLPEDPPDCDLAPVRNPCCCSGCKFENARYGSCPNARNPRGPNEKACHPDNRPDGADVIYVPRARYGNEEDA